MTTAHGIEMAGPEGLLALAKRLQDAPSRGQAVLTLAANSDPAAPERGFIAALRDQLETSLESVPDGFSHGWLDWPHDLFNALASEVRELNGSGVALFAWPDGSWEAVTAEIPVLPAAYYLLEPVTFQLVEAAGRLSTVVAVELHRTHAVLREFSGLREVASRRIEGPEFPRQQKTGAEGQEHAERRLHEHEQHHLAAVADEALGQSRGIRALVVIADEHLQHEFQPHVPAGVPLGGIAWNPDRDSGELAAMVAAAAEAAAGKMQAGAIEHALSSSAAVEGWESVAAAVREGRLDRGWLDPSQVLHVYVCGGCQAVTTGANACARCGASPWARVPLPEYVLRQAQRTGATVELGEGGAVTVLREHEGVVGRLRY